MYSLLVVVLLTLAPVSGSDAAPPSASEFLLPDDVSPGQGLGLAPKPTVLSPVALPGGSPFGTSSVPRTFPFGRGAGLGGALGGAMGGAMLVIRRRRTKSSEPLYVVVHGHGGSKDDFSELLADLGVGEDQVVAFDYRTAAEGATSTEASRSADVEAAAAQLDRLIRDLSANHSNIYALHHSKGGAVGVEMIASIDEGRRPPIDGYRGAALLDPAIGAGMLGSLQRFGGIFAHIPDNGGFNVFRCVDGGCRDSRENLGVVAGVGVIAIRNPDAVVTNFTDRPSGLRTYDLTYDGKPSASSLLRNPVAAFRRVFEAHGSVLSNDFVTACIRSEVNETGSCDWRGDTLNPGSDGNTLINLGR
jgi:hypothetical protein